MPMIEFTQRDILRGTVVEPAWYRVRIESIGEEPAAQKEGKTPSTNYPIAGTILFNGDNGDTKFANVPLDWLFNSKAIGFAAGFLKAFGVEPKPGRVNLEAAEGKELDVFVENGEYQGRLVNRVNHKYRVPKSDVTAAAVSA